MQNLTLCVARPSSGLDPHTPLLVSHKMPPVPENHVLIEVDRFGFSANNVTYQALGEAPHFRYFEFHNPPSDGVVSPASHGLVPVWGFGTIVKSTVPSLLVGERVYGYFAPTRYLLLPVSLSEVNKYNFLIPRPHLPPDRRPYNTVRRCTTDPEYDPSPISEDLMMLYRPLFWTAFWCEDWLQASKYRGASSILMSSASSKTAFCLAYLVKKRNQNGTVMKVVGLTSNRNLTFTKNLGLYDEVLDYESLETAKSLQDTSEKWVYIDVAGNDVLNERVQRHFAAQSNLMAGIQLGLTNLSPSAPSAATTHFSTNTALVDPAGPVQLCGQLKLEQFFMPEWLVVRRSQMTVLELIAMQAQAWKDLMEDGKDWVKIERLYGGAAIVDAYRRVATNGTDAASGMIWSLWDSPELGRKPHAEPESKL
ncbi:hypothetical protein BDW22DRAFT_1323844 [Trametopsis cervina]|nr:hypothetical protein BDW22DRAFT_1323844 [Trametopsis cervina]